MVVSGSGSRSVSYWILGMITAFLLAMPSVAEAAKKKKKNGKKKGAAAAVNVKVNVNAGKGKGKKGKGGRNRAFARNNDIFAVDENQPFFDSFDDGFGRRGRGRFFRPVRLSDGRVLDIAQDGNGNFFPIRAGVVSPVAGVSASPATVSNPDGDILTADQLLGTTPLQPIGRGQLLTGSDSRGQRLPQNVIQSIQLFNSGGRPE